MRRLPNQAVTKTWTMLLRILHAGRRAACVVSSLVLLTAAATWGSDKRRTDTVQATQRVLPSVVNIHTEKTSRDAAYGATRKVNGMGTGIIVDERGYIVTNQHVVANVDSMRVTLHNHQEYQAEPISYDPRHDLAIIKINSKDPLPVAPFGTSADLMVGETVIAVGNAFGYEHSVSQGIVSQLMRNVEVDEKQGYKNLIQTDASINPGNSGGPLVNLDGEIIGINVAIRAQAQRIGFAIPVDDARVRIAKLLNIKHLSETWHGLVARDEKKTIDEMKLVVQSTEPNSPAQAAGLIAGDVVTQVGEQAVRDQADWERTLLGRKAGEQIEIKVLRGGSPTTLNLTLGDDPSRTNVARNNTTKATVIARANNLDPNEERIWNQFGLRLAAEEPGNVQNVSKRFKAGMKVVEVRPNSPAARERIQRNDILCGLHKWETARTEDVLYALNHPEVQAAPPVEFWVLRNGQTLFGKIQIPSITQAASNPAPQSAQAR